MGRGGFRMKENNLRYFFNNSFSHFVIFMFLLMAIEYTIKAQYALSHGKVCYKQQCMTKLFGCVMETKLSAWAKEKGKWAYRETTF